MRRRHTFYAVLTLVLYGWMFSSKAQAQVPNLNPLTDPICAQSAKNHQEFIACNNNWLIFYVDKLKSIHSSSTKELDKKQLCLDAAWSLLHIDPFWINYIESSNQYNAEEMAVYKNPEYFASTCSDVIHHYLYLKKKTSCILLKNHLSFLQKKVMMKH